MDQQIKVDLLLSDYEEVAAQAVDNGIDLTTQVFFIFLPCVELYFDFYIHFLFVFSSPSDLTALSLLEEFTFSLFFAFF